ncbi:caspase-8 [Mastacembelus armatus]|uniref:Caspase-8 n=1 Tax=Mastacembelus armatus TaxID=205130 RepID=A0A3Q3MLS1_9TELE|nr:caspase-8-like [Mastacembelus armatus]XP_026170396.1 caspase-8-like [Mastacembelus armatus]
MDRLTLSRIDDQLDSTDVASLCFLCRDVINRKRLEGVVDAKMLFLRLEEKSLLDNSFFLSQLLHTIHRADLLSLLETDSRRPEESDASPTLSAYRVMLYKIYEDITQDHLDTMKFLLTEKLNRRQIEASNTALDLFVEMEKTNLLSSTNVHELRKVLQEFSQQLVQTIDNYIIELTPQRMRSPPPDLMDCQSTNNFQQPTLSVPETQPSYRDCVFSDENPNCHPPDETEYYALNHIPRGYCVVINNQTFSDTNMRDRAGTEEDEKALCSLFTKLGFMTDVHKNLTANNMRHELHKLSCGEFSRHDALVVCVLSHGEKGCVFGIDGNMVSLQQLTSPFTSDNVRTLAGKPKLFFIQACQGKNFQKPCPQSRSFSEENDKKKSHILEHDGGETIPSDADFLLGMATVSECRSFRNVTTGSIYIQELCRQLKKSAESSERDDILTVLTRVNREVSKGEYLNHKQMPEPKYTLTKKLVLKFVN